MCLWRCKDKKTLKQGTQLLESLSSSGGDSIFHERHGDIVFHEDNAVPCEHCAL